MLSVETESKLAKIFLALAEGEKTIDINRQILVELENFDPYQIFTYLDTNQKNYLNNQDLLNYFTEKGINTNELEINLLILFYDMDYDGVLSYPEFAYFIQSDYSKRGLIQNDNNNANEINNLNNNVNINCKKIIIIINQDDIFININKYNIFNNLKYIYINNFNLCKKIIYE